LNERVIKIDVAASPDVQYDYYYNHQWQVVEVRKDNDTDPLEQWLWHQHYIDAPAIRYYDDNVDGASIATQYFTHDANFNVTALVNSSGAVQERYEYDPYGMTTVLDANFANDADTISDYLNPITYAGYRADAETGLYQVRNRYLNPGLGRWVTRDPAAYVDGMSLYQYVQSLPTVLSDPSGEDSPGCDLPEWVGGKGINEKNTPEARCMRRCCARHDAAFHDNKCTWASWSWNAAGAAGGAAAGAALSGGAAAVHGCGWGLALAGWISPCADANNDVMWCFLACGLEPTHNQGSPEWYCPLQGRFITICKNRNRPGRPPTCDFETLDDAKKACRND
jgi:RHS repeat-associated protein